VRELSNKINQFHPPKRRPPLSNSLTHTTTIQPLSIHRCWGLGRMSPSKVCDEFEIEEVCDKLTCCYPHSRRLVCFCVIGVGGVVLVVDDSSTSLTVHLLFCLELSCYRLPRFQKDKASGRHLHGEFINTSSWGVLRRERAFNCVIRSPSGRSVCLYYCFDCCCLFCPLH
jgi:hypothetical protein